MPTMIENSLDTLDLLSFRRQFLLGPEKFHPNRFWRHSELSSGMHLSAHCDLPYFTESVGGKTLTLIGIAVDPFHPERQESEILQVLLSKSEDLARLIDSTYSLAGRWAVIFEDNHAVRIFTDP